ncbi:flavin reductase family protein [Halioxenophilus sp. WMMB6]|uniref:flavin reductase family protein n=1 Tax=Halioxenophilus sp. WMMB6 TaxID=3073815 RepID=UPI00295ED547|nr:flavin reductase family protein [Halioxenophilus sp. WMMB6]
MITNLAQLSPNQRYHTITQCLVPRPVAWVISENSDSSLNLAPFSYFGGVASDPPLLMLSIGKKPDGTIKDTRKNIIERNHFVVHIAHRELAPAVTESSRTRNYGESEISAQNLQTVAFDGFPLPRLNDCRVAFGCECYRVEEITETQAMILGEIKLVYIDDAIVQQDGNRLTVNAEALDPIARLGGNDYALMGGITTVARPK